MCTGFGAWRDPHQNRQPYNTTLRTIAQHSDFAIEAIRTHITPLFLDFSVDL